MDPGPYKPGTIQFNFLNSPLLRMFSFVQNSSIIIPYNCLDVNYASCDILISRNASCDILLDTIYALCYTMVFLIGSTYETFT